MPEDKNLIREMYATLKVVEERTTTIVKNQENNDKRFLDIETDIKSLQQGHAGLMAKVGMAATVAASIVASIVHRFIQ